MKPINLEAPTLKEFTLFISGAQKRPPASIPLSAPNGNNLRPDHLFLQSTKELRINLVEQQIHKHTLCAWTSVWTSPAEAALAYCIATTISCQMNKLSLLANPTPSPSPCPNSLKLSHQSSGVKDFSKRKVYHIFQLKVRASSTRLKSPQINSRSDGNAWYFLFLLLPGKVFLGGGLYQVFIHTYTRTWFF